jgi:hypothetical protein
VTRTGSPVRVPRHRRCRGRRPQGATDAQRSPPGASTPQPLRDYRLRKLLNRRLSLAKAAAEHLSHDLITDPLWQAVDQVEEQLRREFPAVWEKSYTDWVATDAARLHTADRPAPDSCWICRQRQDPEAKIRPAS